MDLGFVQRDDDPYAASSAADDLVVKEDQAMIVASIDAEGISGNPEGGQGRHEDRSHG